MAPRFGRVAGLVALVGLAAVGRASAQGRPPIEHEPVAPNAADDLALGLRLDGEIPAAVQTPSGVVAAPDPRAPVPPAPVPPTPDGPAPQSLAGAKAPGGLSRFRPDTDTRRPGPLPYSDPFTPSTAPWKRLVAFDAVDRDGTLSVRDPSLAPLPLHEQERSDGSEELFFGNLVVDVRPNEPLRIPSVGPGARVIHARLGIGAEDLDFDIARDGADNWFVMSRRTARARLVLELSIPRAVFGGAFDDGFEDRHITRFAPPLAPAVQRQADEVALEIGVPRATRRATLAALVDYFRGFSESETPPESNRSAYLALALSRKGVCRHRAYAFMITAAGLGIVSRVVMNEAHAWVEVLDGRLWKRVDLGGAGTVLEEPSARSGPAYAPPPDPFRWPPGAARGEDLGRASLVSGAGGSGSAPATDPSPSTTTSAARAPALPDARPPSTVALSLVEGSAMRGEPVHVKGTVSWSGAPCPRERVSIAARDVTHGRAVALGSFATDETGQFSGALVVPPGVALGEYDLLATTPGSTRCAPGSSP